MADMYAATAKVSTTTGLVDAASMAVRSSFAPPDSLLAYNGVNIGLVSLSVMLAACPQPTASSATPQPVGIAAAGVSADFSRADHVHASDTQRIIATTNASGLYTWTFSPAFGAGVIPVIEAIAVGASASTDVINAQINGTPTNTSVQIRVTRTQVSVVALLGLTILSIPASVGATVIHITARAP